MGLEVGKEIRTWIEKYKKKPYIPVWGELFYILYQIKRLGDTTNQMITAYQVNGQPMFYDPAKKKFCLEAEGVIFRLTVEELATAILERGAFCPTESNTFLV